MLAQISLETQSYLIQGIERRRAEVLKEIIKLNKIAEEYKPQTNESGQSEALSEELRLERSIKVQKVINDMIKIGWPECSEIYGPTTDKLADIKAYQERCCRVFPGIRSFLNSIKEDLKDLFTSSSRWEALGFTPEQATLANNAEKALKGINREESVKLDIGRDTLSINDRKEIIEKYMTMRREIYSQWSDVEKIATVTYDNLKLKDRLYLINKEKELTSPEKRREEKVNILNNRIREAIVQFNKDKDTFVLSDFFESTEK